MNAVPSSVFQVSLFELLLYLIYFGIEVIKVL